MPDIPEGFVAARYIGSGTGLRDGRYYNTDGSLRKDTEEKSALSLEPGDEILLRDEDVYGKTLWHDPNQSLPSQRIGLGKVVKPEHAGKSDQELWDIGYEWHLGRSDFEPIEPLEKLQRRREKAGKKERVKEVSQTVELPPENASAEQEESEQVS